jgi:hypothetical protein
MTTTRFEHARRTADKRSKQAQRSTQSLTELNKYRPITPGMAARTRHAVGYGTRTVSA